MLAAIVLLGEKARLLVPDWAIVLLVLYEIPSLTFSRYASNGLLSARVVCGASICYFLVRLSARTASRTAAVWENQGTDGT